MGNLLEAPAEVLVNTANTVGVMGKGIALMCNERFPKNMREYALACKQNQVVTSKMFITAVAILYQELNRHAFKGGQWL